MEIVQTLPEWAQIGLGWAYVTAQYWIAGIESGTIGHW